MANTVHTAPRGALHHLSWNTFIDFFHSNFERFLQDIGLRDPLWNRQWSDWEVKDMLFYLTAPQAECPAPLSSSLVSPSASRVGAVGGTSCWWPDCEIHHWEQSLLGHPQDPHTEDRDRDSGSVTSSRKTKTIPIAVGVRCSNPRPVSLLKIENKELIPWSWVLFLLL